MATPAAGIAHPHIPKTAIALPISSIKAIASHHPSRKAIALPPLQEVQKQQVTDLKSFGLFCNN